MAHGIRNYPTKFIRLFFKNAVCKYFFLWYSNICKLLNSSYSICGNCNEIERVESLAQFDEFLEIFHENEGNLLNGAKA